MQKSGKEWVPCQGEKRSLNISMSMNVCMCVHFKYIHMIITIISTYRWVQKLSMGRWVSASAIMLKCDTLKLLFQAKVFGLGWA